MQKRKAESRLPTAETDSVPTYGKVLEQLPVRGSLRTQLLDAASSVALNLAEARGKPTRRDQLRFFHIAMGSLRESQAVLVLEELSDTRAAACADALGAHLYRLIQNAR